MSDDRDDYEVGYGKPPLHSRFPKGVSGNPTGRPKGSKNKRSDACLDKLADMILDEADRQVTVKEGGKQVTMTVMQTIIRSIEANAVKGVAKSQQVFLDFVKKAAAHRDARKEALLDAVVTYKLNCRKVFDECDAQGTPRPDLVPHPDDILIDPETGEVALVGPLTREQRDKEDRDRVLGLREEVRQFKRRIHIAETLRCKPETVGLYHKELEDVENSLMLSEKLYVAGQKSHSKDSTSDAE